MQQGQRFLCPPPSRLDPQRQPLPPSVPTAACRLPIVPGEPCKDTFWAFDAKQGRCLTFQGCGGNANKFYLEKECQEYCGLLPSGTWGKRPPAAYSHGKCPSLKGRGRDMGGGRLFARGALCILREGPFPA